jgi:lipopolysaccharide export LptBFGC system permease protein LptF
MPEAKPLFTPEQIATDGQNRLARTMGQVTVPGAIVTVLDYVLQRWANEPALPPAIVSALVVILTAVAAWITLRKKLNGEG